MTEKEIKILAIESSCDETAASVIGSTNNKPIILSNVVSSQVDLHAKTGGVVPEVASRAHMEAIMPVITEALSGAGIGKSDVTHIAVTAGPGLVGSLLVGFNAAKSMAYALEKPIAPINHIEGHIYSALAEQTPMAKKQTPNNHQILNTNNQTEGLVPRSTFHFPLLALVVSGGHTSLILMKDHGEYEMIGETQDDAAGEAFDKVAKLLGLGYPGGPVISKLAGEFRESRNSGGGSVVFPRPLINDGTFNFSFSGLKTAVLYQVKKLKVESEKLNQNQIMEIAAAFEDATVDVLVTKTMRAVAKYKPAMVVLAGGVSANSRLRERLKVESEKLKVDFLVPPIELCGDNAAMIGLAAYYHVLNGDVSSWDQIKVDSNWELG